MKKTTKILVYSLLAIGTVLFLCVFAVTVAGNALDKQSKAFVDAAIPAIVHDWDVMEIRRRASPEFDKSVDYEDMQQLFDVLHGLGELQEYGGATGEARVIVSFEDGFEIVITAVYEATADFESGSAEMAISLIRHNGQWQILGFTIAPEDTEIRKDII